MNKQEQAYSTIREGILDGAYGPGYRLVIGALAANFGISALPVREAIRRLEAEGLVVFRANAGAQVAPADPALFEETMSVLAVLEGYATAAAAPALGEDDLDELEALTDDMAECMDTLDALGFGRANRAFHLVIYHHCSNPCIVELLKDMERRLDAIRRTVFTQIPYRGRESIAEHRELLALLRSSASASKVEAAARQHKVATLEAFRRWRKDHGQPHPARMTA